jgi:hypothetical protein
MDMWKKDVIAYFKARGDESQAAIGRRLKLTRQAVNSWPRIVPQGRAYKLHVDTNGDIPLHPEHYKTSDAAMVA